MGAAQTRADGVNMSIAVERPVDFDELRRAERAVLARLARMRRLLRQHLLVEGLFWVTTTIFVAAAASLLFDRWLRFDLSTRLGLLAIALAAIGYVAYRRLVQPLLLPLANLDLAELIDRRAPGVGQQIANVLELPRLLDSSDAASPSMVRAAVLECLERLDRRDLVATLNAARRRKRLAACSVCIALVVLFSLVWPQTAGLWARRWLAGSTLRWPQHNYLSVVGLDDRGVLLVPRGEIAVVEIDARPTFAEDSTGRWRLGGRGEPLIVESTSAPQTAPPESVAIGYTLPDGTHRRGNASQFDPSHFRYELSPLAAGVALEITGGDDWLGPIPVEPVDRPTVRSLEIIDVAPGSGSPQTERVGEASGQLLYLPQTQLTLSLVADQPLQAAEALDQGLPLAGWQRVDERTYTASWTMERSLALEFRLVGRRGGLVSKPYFLAIGLLQDREPRVTIRSSGVGRRVTPVARIPLAVRANDDFALTSLALGWELTSLGDEEPQVESKLLDLVQPEPDEGHAEPVTQFEYDNELELRDTGLAPGNSLRLRGVATDACALGAQTGYSRWVTFQIVAPDELFYEILMRQREQRAHFAAALAGAKEQSKAISELARPEDVFGLARSQQVINRQVWQVGNQLAATLVEMTLNDLANQQARDTLQSTIISPLGTLHDDLLKRLRAAIDETVQDGKVADERRGEALVLADQAVKVMQTILGQMSLWESFVDVINQLKHVIDGQTGLLKETEKIQQERTNQLFD
jgi:hypothetical protein